MDVKDHPVISVLGDQRRFIVPIYQRQYSWQEARLAPFWDDVVAKAEELADGKPKFSHYMGALILAPGGDGFTIGATPKVQVVDGQQRLTTFQIFLAAIREVCQRRDVEALPSMIGPYLFVPKFAGDKDPDAGFRLIPTPEDRTVFHLIIEGGLAAARTKHPDLFDGQSRLQKKPPPPNALFALDFFVGKIENYAEYGLIEEDDPREASRDEGPNAPATRLHALLDAVLNHLKLVVITLGENDDAQVIFETLNSQAEPLLAMDLVRNNVFQRAAAQGESAEDLFQEKWRPFDQEGGFWKADSPRAKPKRPRIDHFLSHALTAQTGEETSLRELYAEYRRFTRPKGKPRFATVGDELDALTVYRPVYRTLEEGGGDSALGRLGTRLNLWEVSTAYPYVFRVATSAAAPEEKARLYELVYSYIVRRAICGLTPKNLNKTFARLTEIAIQEGASVQAFLSGLLGGRGGDTVNFPTDDDLRIAIRDKPVYEMFKRKERMADLLWDLELASRTKYSVNTARPGAMSIEHVLPQAWHAYWPLPDGRTAVSETSAAADPSMTSAIRARQSVLHTLGNLTLITVPGNTTASNQAFCKKKPWLKQSLLALNLAILERDTWDEAAIADRSISLADLAVEIWPGPTSG